MPALTFGQIEALLTGMLDIDPERASAISARFNTLRRLGFPDGVNVGATGRFKYDLKATLSTMILFALIDSLVLPQQAVTLVRRAWPDIEPAAHAILQKLVFRGLDLVDAPRPAEAHYLTLRPEALSQLRPSSGSKAERKREYRPSEPGRLIVVSVATLQTMLTDGAVDRPHSGFLIVNLDSIVRWTAQAIVRAGWATPAAMGARSIP